MRYVTGLGRLSGLGSELSKVAEFSTLPHGDRIDKARRNRSPDSGDHERLARRV
jgi:hypothetical protein